MKKIKLFIENFLVYGLGGVISKLIPLVMLPLITRMMPGTYYFGLSDLSNTLVQFSSAIAVMGLYDAMYRLFFEKDDNEYKKIVCSTTLFFTCTTSVIVFVILCLFSTPFAMLFFSNKKYSNLVVLSAVAMLIGATNTIISAPTRMQNKRKIYLFINTLSPLIAYGLSIPLLLKGYYLIALPVAAIISAISLEISFLFLNHNWFSIRCFNSKILRQLLVLGVPLLPNLLIYWVFNSCDKIMITSLIGAEATGIYAVASKLGHVSQLIYTAFAGGWQYFAFSTMNDEDQVESNSKIFEYMGVISFLASSFVCIISFTLFRALFKEEYIIGYISAPYLFLAPLLQMLFQIICNQFLVIRKTWPEMFILGSGAIINILLNYSLIPKMGIEGASVATLSGYVVSLLICIIVLLRMKLVIITRRMVLSAAMFIMYFVLWRLLFVSNNIWAVISVTVYGLIVLVLYKNEICFIVRQVRKRKVNYQCK